MVNKSRLVMTLLVRDEIDIIKENIEFHLNHGVDFIIATDNGSVDGTRELLQDYQKDGIVYVIDEPAQDYSQSVWVTRMALLAKEKFGANWILHNDADEFWFPRSGNLKTELENSSFDVLYCNRFNMNLDEEEIAKPNFIFYDLKTKSIKPFNLDFSCVEKYPFFMYTIGNKLIHRASDKVEVEQGNHSVKMDSAKYSKSENIVIYHYPVRGYEQFKMKVINGGSSYERNTSLPKEVGWHWRRWYKLYLENKLEEEYKKFILSKKQLEKYHQSGNIIFDYKLKENLENNYNSFIDQSMTEIYDEEFYKMHNDWEKEYRFIANELNAMTNPGSVLDLGCGNGYLLKTFAEKGKKIKGIDGSFNAINSIQYPLRENFHQKDLRQPLYVGRYDLVICSEVAEHLEEQYADLLIDNICRSSKRYIFFTGATPEQTGGVNHVNLQQHEYWIEKFSNHGFHLLKKQTAQLRTYMQSNIEDIVWFTKNSMLFEKCASEEIVLNNFEEDMKICLISCYLLSDEMCNVLNELENELKKQNFLLIILSHASNPKLSMPLIKVPYSFSEYYSEIKLPENFKEYKKFDGENEWIDRDKAFSGNNANNETQITEGLIRARFYFESLLDNFTPSMVLLWGNTLPQSSLQKEICKSKNIPVYIIERGLYPLTMMIEKEGNGADSELNSVSNILESDEQLSSVKYSEIKNYYLSKNPEKYSQSKYKNAEEFKSFYKISDDQKIIVFWGQHDVWGGLVPRDTELSKRNSPWFASTKEAFEKLSKIVSLRNDYVLFFKPHPHDTIDYQTDCSNVIIIREENNRSLMEVADLFAAMSSTVQFEALLYEKPILLLANSQLIVKQVAYEYDVEKSLEELIENAILKKDFSDRKKYSEKFVEYLFEKFLFGYDNAPTQKKILDIAQFIAEKGLKRTGNFGLNSIINHNQTYSKENGVKAIAFYLPQYHPIPENDKAWGKGFTEWTNVTKAEPLFSSHYQPHKPSELGYYDLRSDEIRKEQIKLAKQYGIYGFCYYYYWFNGKEALETPIKKLLANKELDFPFCVCWANENWTRKWDGHDNDVIFKQEHNAQDDLNFIRSLIPYFKDNRYITVDGKPVLLIYRTELFPEIKKTSAAWRNEVKKHGFKDLYLVRVESFIRGTNPNELGFDAAVEFAPDWGMKGKRKLAGEFSTPKLNSLEVYEYKDLMNNMLAKVPADYKLFRGVTPCWDNSARRGHAANVFINSTPELYKQWLSKVIVQTKNKFVTNEQFIFINAWNEWGEGNHLEPDKKYGRAFLEATKAAFTETANEHGFSIQKGNASQEISQLKQQISQSIEDGNLFSANMAIIKYTNSFNDESFIKTCREILDIARQALRTKLKWNSKKGSQYLVQAENFIEKENFDEAKKKLIMILNVEPEHLEALNDLAVVHIINNDNDSANELINIILTICPQNETALNNYAYLNQLNVVEENNEIHSEIISETTSDSLVR